MKGTCPIHSLCLGKLGIHFVIRTESNEDKLTAETTFSKVDAWQREHNLSIFGSRIFGFDALLPPRSSSFYVGLADKEKGTATINLA